MGSLYVQIRSYFSQLSSYSLWAVVDAEHWNWTMECYIKEQKVLEALPYLSLFLLEDSILVYNFFFNRPVEQKNALMV